MAPACPEHSGDTGEGQLLPPTVPSVQHSGSMAVFEQDASAHRVMQERG